MNKILYLLLLITAISLQLKAQRVVYHMRGYDSYFNQQTKIPDSVIYTAQPHVKKAGRLSGFHGNYVSDYKHSGFDLGHMANAEDMNYSDTSEYDSFSTVNIFPQTPQDNRIVWLAIENYVRSLNCPVRVKISWQGVAGYLGKDSLVIPVTCVKEIWYRKPGDNGRVIYERFEVPNTTTVNQQPFTVYRNP